jgi:tetrahydrodipicolinate N-succinyltransferase
MIRYLPILLVLSACGTAAQRDAALGAVVAGTAASAACGLSRPASEAGKIRAGACIVVGGSVAIGGGVLLHSQLEPARPAGE